MDMIQKSKLFVINALSCVTLIVFLLVGCEKKDSNDELEIEKFKAEYGLKTINDNNVIEFNSIYEAELFLQGLKDRSKKEHKMTFNPKASGNGSYSFSYKGQSFNGPRLKSGEVEETGYTSSTGAGLFSDWNIGFNTTSGGQIDKSSIKLTTSGVRVGWAYTQAGVIMNNSTSFIVKGTVTVGIGIAGATVGYEYDVYIQINVNFDDNTVTWHEIER